jgi:mRNA interferase RelE/StbE
MASEVLLIREAVEDFEALDGGAKLIVLNALRKLRNSPELRGQPLGSNLGGNLTGYRRAVVGNRTYRIIFRVQDDNTVAVVSVIAKRADDEVYKVALARVQLHEDEDIRNLAVPLASLLKV